MSIWSIFLFLLQWIPCQKGPDVQKKKKKKKITSVAFIVKLSEKLRVYPSTAQKKLQHQRFGLHMLQSNLNSSNTDGSITMTNSYSFLSPHEILPITQENKCLVFYLFYHEIVCCVCLLESPHRCYSSEYTQHTIIVQKIKKISLNYRYLLPHMAP